MVVKEHINGLFTLCQMDLHHNNILMDDDFNITGIIDCSDAQTVPLERFMISPNSSLSPPFDTEQNAPTVAFREKFAAALRASERES